MLDRENIGGAWLYRGICCEEGSCRIDLYVIGKVVIVLRDNISILSSWAAQVLAITRDM